MEKKRLARNNSAKRRIARLRQVVDEVKSKPCADCGNSFNPWQMDLDHKPEHGKTMRVSRMVSNGWSLASIKQEIQYCDVVCACCHRQRTHEREYASVPRLGVRPDPRGRGDSSPKVNKEGT